MFLDSTEHPLTQNSLWPANPGKSLITSAWTSTGTPAWLLLHLSCWHCCPTWDLPNTWPQPHGFPALRPSLAPYRSPFNSKPHSLTSSTPHHLALDQPSRFFSAQPASFPFSGFLCLSRSSRPQLNPTSSRKPFLWS